MERRRLTSGGAQLRDGLGGFSYKCAVAMGRASPKSANLTRKFYIN
jgi:hypothetical protein